MKKTLQNHKVDSALIPPKSKTNTFLLGKVFFLLICSLAFVNVCGQATCYPVNCTAGGGPNVITFDNNIDPATYVAANPTITINGETYTGSVVGGGGGTITYTSMNNLVTCPSDIDIFSSIPIMGTQTISNGNDLSFNPSGFDCSPCQTVNGSCEIVAVDLGNVVIPVGCTSVSVTGTAATGGWQYMIGGDCSNTAIVSNGQALTFLVDVSSGVGFITICKNGNVKIDNVSVQDNCCMPSITCPLAGNFACDADLSSWLAPASEACEDGALLTNTFSHPGCSGGTQTVTFTLTASDGVTVLATCEQDITITAASDPVAISCPVYPAVTCSAAQALTTASYPDLTSTNTETDACDITITATASNVNLAGLACDGTGVVVVTYTVSDNCGGVYADLVCDQTVIAATAPDPIACPVYPAVTCSAAQALTTASYPDLTSTNTETVVCDITITATASNVNLDGLTCDGTGVVVVTYTVTDNCGGSYADLVCDQTVMASTAPDAIVCPVYPAVTCSAAQALTTASYPDLTSTNTETGVCDITITATASNVNLDGLTCDGTGVVVVTYTVTDNCGGVYADLVCDQTVMAASAPDAIVCPDYPAVTCSAAQALTTASYDDITSTNTETDACDITITATASDVNIAGLACDGTGVVVVTYTVTDNCGGVYADLVCDQTVIAATAPDPIVCPVYPAVTCSAAQALTTASYPDLTSTNTETGVCDITVTATASDVNITGLACDGTGVVVVTYTVSDNCGGVYADLVCDQTVMAATAPDPIVCPVYPAVTCSAAQALTTADYPDLTSTNTETGVCDITITATASNVNLAGICDGTGVVVVTYTVTDNCGGVYADLVCDQILMDATLLNVSCPNAPVILPACSNENEILEAYNDWVAEFAINDGCNPIGNLDQIPDLPDYECGGGYTLDFELIVSDFCNPDGITCSSSFTLTAPDPANVCEPMPNAIGDLEICEEGGSINIDGNPMGGSEVYTSHLWSIFDDGGTGANASNLSNVNSQIVTVDVTGIALGTIVLEYEVTDDDECTGSTMVELTINPLPIPSLNCSAQIDQCAGDFDCMFDDLNTFTINNGTLVNPEISGTATQFFTDPINGILDPSIMPVNVPYYFILTLTDPVTGCLASIRCDFIVVNNCAADGGKF